MFLVYLDDFGHVGPYVSATHSRFNTSPVFGFAGFALPEDQVRPFSSFFKQIKSNVCKADLESCGLPAFRWEKKGTNLFTKKSITKYPSVREAGFRILREIKERKGFVFYYGREKVRCEQPLNTIGLQTTILSHAIRRLDGAFTASHNRFALVMDQSSSRPELLNAAQKTMFGKFPCRQLVSPPFEVESHLDQNMQAADWLATITGRIWSYRLDQAGFGNQEPYDRYFGERLRSVSHRSSVEKHADLRVGKSQKTVLLRETTTTIVQERLVISDDASVKDSDPSGT